MAIHARRGERVGPDGIAELAQTDQMYAVAEVYETDIGRVAVGQPATIRSPALNANLTGSVERIGMKIGKLDVLDTDPVARTDARVVEVHIKLDEPKRAAKPVEPAGRSDDRARDRRGCERRRDEPGGRATFWAVGWGASRRRPRAGPPASAMSSAPRSAQAGAPERATRRPLPHRTARLSDERIDRARRAGGALAPGGVRAAGWRPVVARPQQMRCAGIGAFGTRRTTAR